MKILAVTGCPEGIAYTYIAAEALQKVAYQREIDLLVERQAALGIDGLLTQSDIDMCDGIIIATDYPIDLKRFDGKNYIVVSTKEVIKNPDLVFDRLLETI